MKRFSTMLAAMGTVVAAHAQTQDYTPVNVALRGGGVYIFDDATRSVTGNMIGIGIDYFIDTKWFENSETSFSFDWLGKSASGAKGNAFPLLLNQRWYTAGTERGNRTYGFVGLGVYIIDVNKSDTVFGGRIGFGIELGENIFTEGSIWLSDGASGARISGIGGYIGYRF